MQQTNWCANLPPLALSAEETGKRFVRFREQAGLDVQQVAVHLQVPGVEVEKTEDGRYQEVSAHLIIDLAHLYGCQVSEFFNPLWDERDPEKILALLERAEIGEGMAARMLCGGDRLALRLMQEQWAKGVQHAD